MNQKRNCIYIPTIDAKDIYLANCLKEQAKNRIGFQLLTKSGSVSYRRFISTLDFSLDSEKIREIAATVYDKKDDFSFYDDGKEYSDKIINVTFQYSSRTFNKMEKNTYVREGYLPNDLVFEDNISVDGNTIVGIIVSTPTKHRTKRPLPDGFDFAKDENGDDVYTVGTLDITRSRKDLRDDLYENGFNCNGCHYVRLKRTAGSARVGKCLFVEERIYPQLHAWELCGLPIEEGDNVDLAALESYLSLSASSAIDILHVDPKSILIIPDCESRFYEDSVIVEMDDDKRIAAREGQAEITNSLFDGQSLIDQSAMGNYAHCGMVLLRNRFFKSCCFNTNLGLWFREQNITELSQLHRDAVTLAEKIEDIKLVTTPSSIKYMKFASPQQWLHHIDAAFSIVKCDKKTHFFGGRMVQAHYQLLNTLQLSPEEVSRLLKPSLGYVNLLNTDLDVLKYHVRCNGFDSPDGISNVFMNKADIIYTMMNVSDLFYQTKYFYDFKKETCKAYLNNLKKGHILINGNYSVLFGNPYEMLLHTIGQFDSTLGKTSLPPGHIHTHRYPYGKKLLGCRSPHISTSNVLISTNMEHALIDRYFNLTEEIVCLNAVNENILERLSGADYDSDQMILTDNEILVDAALKNYTFFKVPANRVAARKSQRSYTNADKSDLDYHTSENKIGEIVNLSQELNTLMWDRINKSGADKSICYEIIREIYHDICILNVLSCIEIDKAKKEFDISSGRELREIKERWMRRTEDDKVMKPAFLGYIAQTKGYQNTEKKQYAYHRTTMDYLLKEIRQYRSKKTKANGFVPLSECFRFPDFCVNSVNKKQLYKIIDMCEATVAAINAVWAAEYYTLEEKYLLAQQYRDNLAEEIEKMKMNQHTLFVLLTYTDKKKYTHIAKLLFFVLFHYKNEMLIEIMSRLNETSSYIKEEKNGELDLYGIKFVRCKKQGLHCIEAWDAMSDGKKREEEN